MHRKKDSTRSPRRWQEMAYVNYQGSAQNRRDSPCCISPSPQQCFVQRMYRVQDLQAYMLRLFLEYAVRPPASCRHRAADNTDSVSFRTLQRLSAPEGVETVSTHI
jgi:hypothetical protein